MSFKPATLTEDELTRIESKYGDIIRYGISDRITSTPPQWFVDDRRAAKFTKLAEHSTPGTRDDGYCEVSYVLLFKNQAFRINGKSTYIAPDKERESMRKVLNLNSTVAPNDPTDSRLVQFLLQEGIHAVEFYDVSDDKAKFVLYESLIRFNQPAPRAAKKTSAGIISYDKNIRNTNVIFIAAGLAVIATLSFCLFVLIFQ